MEIISYSEDIVENARKSIICLVILVSIITATIATNQQIHSSETIQQLPFCEEDEIGRTISRRLVYVSTLDGKLTALDISNGDKHWSIETGPGPLISSSIHRLELTNNGQWVRMIPSLYGGLYKFNGETIDPIPITADNLLSSSFKFTDDLVISGGKETRSYGVSARTGQLLYKCTINGCINSTDSIPENVNQKHGPLEQDDIINNTNQHDHLLDEVVVVRRQTQTVRAIEPRSGVERWNFSVGHHELELLEASECHERPRSVIETEILNFDISVIVPEGILLAFNRNEPRKIIWKYKFDYPIVNAWRVDKNNRIRNIDLFNSTKWLWNLDKENIIDREGWVSPSIYVGMFQKQLYIQESQNLFNIITTKTRNLEYNLLNDDFTDLPSIPWKPIPAISSSSLNLITDNSELIPLNENDQFEKSKENDEHSAVTALSVLYASEYVNGNGFFLFTSSELNKTNGDHCNSENSTTTINETAEDNYNFEFIDDETPVKIIIVSLWFWWKEIIVISLTSAVVLNLFLSPRIRREKQVLVIERHIPVPTAIEATEESMSRSRNSQRSLSESNSNDYNGQFQSRFQTDFDLVQCLGKGGFGVVFEAKNKIDDCNYAVKRIALPNKKESRDRVMREVKTLANCEHQNIVRYFQAWIENPPPGWQEEEDRKWMQRDILSTSIDIETPDGTTLPPFSSDATNLKKSLVNGSYTNKYLLQRNWSKNLKNDNQCSNHVPVFSGYDYDKSLRYIVDDNSCSFIQFKTDENSNSISLQDSKDNDINENVKSSENSLKKNTTIEIKDDEKSFGPPQIELDTDSSDSFEIEFKAPSSLRPSDKFKNGKISTNTNNSSFEKSSICQSSSYPVNTSTSRNNSTPKTTRHKRPMSLDLSSKGNVIVPIPSPSKELMYHRRQNEQQNKVYLYIQMQLCRKESLKDWLSEHKIEMRRPHISNIFEQIIDAVNYVHLKGLIHRDLKPSNIFFSLDGRIKIGDFGLVTDMSTMPASISTPCDDKNGLPHCSKHTQQVGTHLYMSPEQLQGHSYDFKVDIYSLGLIFFELLVYFSTEMERIITLKNLRNGKFPEDFNETFPKEYELLNLMLSLVPDQRPTTFQIKEKIIYMKPSLLNGEKSFSFFK